MSDSDQAFPGRCEDCGKLHRVIVVSPLTSSEISRAVQEMQEDGLLVELTTVGKARPEFAMCESGSE